MKQTYLTPNTTYLCIECDAIIATSPNSQIGIDKSSSGNEQLSNKQQGTWGDIWSK